MANDTIRGRQTALRLTNKSGAAVAEGDVVIIDSTTATSFTTTASEAQTADSVGVALETIADNATGRVVVNGYAPNVALDGAASLGDSVCTDGVKKQGTPHAALASGDFGQVLETGTTPDCWLWGGMPLQVVSAGSAFYSGYICVRDKKAQNTEGGTFTAGAWQVRDINDEQADTGSNCSIASNQITLDAGTYNCYITCPAMMCDNHQTRLWNDSDSSVEIVGTNVLTNDSDTSQSLSIIAGAFTIAAQKTFEVQHYCTTTRANNGFGVRANLTDEIYTIAEFWKHA